MMQIELFTPHSEVPFPAGIPIDVVKMFERFALEVIASGRRHYSARAILHRIRWYENIERRRDDFKCNNNWTPALSRWFMAKYPKHDGFFETRESLKRKHSNADATAANL